MMLVTRLLILAVLLVSACAPSGTPASPDARAGAPPSTESRLDGAWQLVRSEVITPDGTTIPGNVHESLLLFSDGHYSMNWAGGEEPSPWSEQRLRPTDEEKVARYGRLIVNAGRYELADGVLTIRPEFALVPEYVGGLGEFDATLDGDTLDLVWRTIDAADGTPDPSTAAGVRFRYQWTRR